MDVITPKRLAQSSLHRRSHLLAPQKGFRPVSASSVCARDQAAAQEGATAPPPVEEVVNLHFAALVERDGRCPALARNPAGRSMQPALLPPRGLH